MVYSIFVLGPTPATWLRQLCCGYQCITPHMASLVGCPLDMFLQSCLGWWYQMHIVILCEKFLSWFVDVCAYTCSVMSRITNLSINCMTYFGILLGIEDNFRSESVNSGKTFQIAQPDFQILPSKTRNVVTPILSLEHWHWQCLCLLWSLASC